MVSLWSRLHSNQVAWNVAARGGGLVSAAVATWIVAKLGGATEVGIYALLRVLPATLGVLVAGGLPGAATYFLAGPSRDDRRVPLTLIAIAGAGGAGGVVLWLAATPLLHRVFFSEMATVLVALAGARVFTYLVFSTGRACLQGVGDLPGSNWVIVGEDFFFLPALVACWAAGLGGLALMVAALLLGDVANGVLAWGMLARRRFFSSVAWPTPALARRIYVFGVRGQLGNLLLLLNLRLDFVILGALAGAAPLGAYALASRFAELLRLLPVSVFWVFYPRYARAPRTVAASQARAMIPRLSRGGVLPLDLRPGVPGRHPSGSDPAGGAGGRGHRRDRDPLPLRGGQAGVELAGDGRRGRGDGPARRAPDPTLPGRGSRGGVQQRLHHDHGGPSAGVLGPDSLAEGGSGPRIGRERSAMTSLSRRNKR
jgi:hypothetical protein